MPVKIMLSDLPNLMIAEFMTRLELVHTNWKILDKIPYGSGGASGAGVRTTSQ